MLKVPYPFTLNRLSKQAAGLLFWGPGLGSGNLFDLSGEGRHCDTIFGTQTTTGGRWVEGVDGRQSALNYNGSNNYSIMSSSTAVPVLSAVTVSCWIRTTFTAGDTYFFSKWGAGGGTDCFLMKLASGSGVPVWNVSTNGSYQSGHDCTATTGVADGLWHLVTGTWDGATEAVYVDGVQQATVAVASPASSNSSEVRLGALSDGSNLGNSLHGDMDDPRLYNVALSSQVVSEMYDPRTRWELRYRPKSFGRLNTSPVLPKVLRRRMGS